MPPDALRRAGLLLAVSSALLLPTAAHAEWVRDDTSMAWTVGSSTVWKFSFDPRSGKPYFHPVTIGGGPSLTNFKPEDHPWHYGLWFSWKYINGVNYWEENRTSGQASGSTRWSTPVIDARPDGSARITMELTYARAPGEVDLTETRELLISAPAADGSYTIDWNMRFKAGKAGAVLDRTPMPGEPKGAFNGGYAGLSARLAAAPLEMSVVSTEGPVTQFARDRARPSAAAVAGNFADGGKHVGGIAILSDPANIAEKAPWYIINSANEMRFLCAAVLAPAVRTIPAGGEWNLRYRVALRRAAWTQDALNAAVNQWLGMRGAATRGKTSS